MIRQLFPRLLSVFGLVPKKPEPASQVRRTCARIGIPVKAATAAPAGTLEILPPFDKAPIQGRAHVLGQSRDQSQEP